MSCSIHTEIFSESVFDRGHNGLPASPESPLDTEDIASGPGVCGDGSSHDM